LCASTALNLPGWSRSDRGCRNVSRRPRLALNATIVSEDRVGLDSDQRPGCLSGLGRDFLRRRTSDEFFHFAFTDHYFGMLGADLRPFPLAGGVAASAAFPALIDTERLPDRCHYDGRSAVPVLQLIYSAVQFGLRKQLYLAQQEWLEQPGQHVPQIVALHVSLTGLDQYAEGGTEVALWTKSALTDESRDIAKIFIDRRRAIQHSAWLHLSGDPEARTALRLPARNPQCYYDMRAQLDASLVSLTEDNQACLRESAVGQEGAPGVQWCVRALALGDVDAHV
jgi:hypothetical protein